MERIEDASSQHPIHCVFRIGPRQIAADIVNFHFNGACLRLQASDVESFQQALKLGMLPELDLHIGLRSIRETVGYRLCWEALQDEHTVGIQFASSIRQWVERDSRFPTHPSIRPTLVVADPLDPNRQIFLAVENFSKHGMQVSTSISNKHLLPGMALPSSSLQIPGQQSLLVDLEIRNTRLDSSNPDRPSLMAGLSITNVPKEFGPSVKAYLTSLGPTVNAPSEEHQAEGDLRKINETFEGKEIKSSLSFRIVKTAKDYEQVLKLRFLGYSKHGKVKPGQTWKSQGEGLESEGVIIAAYAAGKVVGSMELRFWDGDKPFRFIKKADLQENQSLRGRNLVEVNKLVVHPDAQGSDIVLGLIQKIHSTLLTRGTPDVILCATDKLVPLYMRIGGKKIGLRIPHPTISSEFLNLMMIKRDVYLGVDRFNPYAWEQIYGTVHNAYARYGSVNAYDLSVSRRITKKISAFLHKGKKAKGTDTSRSTERRIAAKGTYSIDPKWTEQHMLASVIQPYILEAENCIGYEKTSSILSEIGVPRDYFEKQSNWVSVAFLNTFQDKYKIYGNLNQLNRKAGIRGMSREIMGMNYFLLKHFLTPEFAFRSFASVVSKFNRSRAYTVYEWKNSRAVVGIGLSDPSLLPRHKETCENWQATFERYLEIMTGSKGQVLKKSCCYEGAKECIYEVKWNPYRKRVTDYIEHLSVSGSLGLFGASILAPTFAGGLAHRALACTIAVLLLDQLTRNKKRFAEANRLKEDFEQYQSETTERYLELQRAEEQLTNRYREVSMLESLSKEIQQSKELDQILRVSIGSICKMLEFNRAFVMLKSENSAELRTAAVFGISENTEAIWKFRVPLSKKRDNPALLSSVYHSGSSVIIEDVNKHIFQLNEESQKLIASLKAQSFVMVPIPSEDGRWGVILADRSSEVRQVTASDLHSFQRAAQHLGLALDKKAKLDQETRLKQVFSRYVPTEVLNQAEQDPSSVLGGQLRPLQIMFLDVRGFTSITEKLPPQQTLNLLNLLFHEVHKIVSRHGGIIDKFLGDGVLVTWGAIGSARNLSPTASVQAALDISNILPEVNATLRIRGLPEIGIGMGLHSGSAIVGNIGTEQRMEFTVIGPAVNFASRLEGLNKEYGSQIVISEQLYENMSPEMKEQFTIEHGVPIRGFSTEVVVAHGPKKSTQVKEGKAA